MSDLLKKFNKKLDDALDKAKQAKFDDERQRLLSTIGQDLARMLSPFLSEVASSSKLNKESLKTLMDELRYEVADRQMQGIDTTPIISAIESTLGNFKIPEPKVTVSVPSIKVPDVIMPDEMNVKGWVRLMGVDLNNPLPVQLRDHKGNPINLFENLTAIVSGGGGGGGKHDYFTVKGFSQSAYTEIMNADGRLKVSVETGGTGLTDTELRATAVPVSQVSGANWSVSVAGSTGSLAATILNGDGNSLDPRDRNWTITEQVPVVQVSGHRWSTEATQGTSPWVVSATDLDVRDIANATDSISAYQVSGHSWSTEATQSGTWNIGTVTTVTNITNSLAASIIDSSGVQYSGSNPVPITGSVSITGSLASTVATGPTAVDANDDGSSPVQIGGIARTANPTAVSGGDVIKTSHDDLGRPITRPIQMRDLIVTAYASLTNGTEATLLAATAGSFHDLVYVMAANNSDVAVTVDIRPVTAGNVIMTIQVPANGTAGIACPVPLPQSGSDTGNNWTADIADITGTTVYLTALFSKEI